MKTKLTTIIVAILLVAVGKVTAQTEFKYSETEINDYVVTEVPGKTASEMYTKTIAWMVDRSDLHYVNKSEDTYIEVGGKAKDVVFYKGRPLAPLDFVVRIAFKDNKYKFELVKLVYTNDDPLTVKKETDYKKLAFRSEKMKKKFGETPDKIEDFFNQLNLSLKNYILGIKESNPSGDDW